MTPRLRRALWLALLSGYVALSWEIVWARLLNFASESRAPAFGAMLGSYLLGLALGSLWSMRWQVAAEERARRNLAWLMLAANTLAYLVVPVSSWLAVGLPAKIPLWPGLAIQSWFWMLPLVALASALQGTVLPLLCHVAIPPDEKAGARLSYVYLANIIGSGAGSLLTGFVLMEMLPMARLSQAVLFISLLLPCLLMGAQSTRRFPSPGPVGAAILAVFLLGLAGPRLLFPGLWERLQYKTAYDGTRFATVVESKHGVITIDNQRKIYGNGAYDGAIDCTLTPGDWHVRPYFLSAVHPHPRRILVIGMSGGAWTQILASHPQSEQVDVVEISRAYLKVIAAYPQVSSVLKNPKVRIHIDDGRRWLKRHPGERYDAILMNNTHHWREFASALLSRECLQILRAHLAPGGVVIWNCTGSGRAAKTGLEVFPHTMMCLNNCIGSNEPLRVDPVRWRKILETYRIDGQPVFDLATARGRADLDEVLRIASIDSDPPSDGLYERMWTTSRERMQRLWGDAEPITDDNLGHEYR